MSTFKDFNLDKQLLKKLEKHNYTKTTQIQSLVIPEALQGNNIIAFSKTGSGKTLAFLVPILQNLTNLKWTKSDGLGSVVIVPTRELALQIYDMLKKINTNYTIGLLIGGTNLKTIDCQILIGTPGRLLAVLQNGNYTAKIVVLDEIDKMSEMGFNVEEIIEYLYGDKQILRFSATCGLKVVYDNNKNKNKNNNKNIDYDSAIKIEENCKVILGDVEMPHTLKQYFYKVEMKDKINLLFDYVKNNKRKCLVFFSTCKEVRFISMLFKRINVNILHGNMNQEKRIAELENFRKKKEGFLFCTDIGARGLDIEGVDVVLQFDCPENAETYVHRVGRCGRNGKEGVSMVYLVKDEEKLVADIEKRKWKRATEKYANKRRKKNSKHIKDDIKQDDTKQGVIKQDEKDDSNNKYDVNNNEDGCVVIKKHSKNDYKDKVRRILQESVEAEMYAVRYLKSYVKYLQFSKKYFGETLKEVEKMKNYLGIADEIVESIKDKNYTRKTEKIRKQD